MGEAKARKLPRVEYVESWVRSDNPVFVFGSLLTQHQFSATNFAVDSLNRPHFLNNFQSLVTAEQTLWDGARVKGSVELAGIHRKSAEIGRRQVELALASRTARAYLDTLLAAAAVPVAEESVRAAEADSAKATAIRDAGRSTDLDVLSIHVHLSQAREHVILRKAEHRVALAALAELIGAAQAADLRLTTPIRAPLTPALQDAPDRPDLALAGSSVAAAQKHVELAKAARLPQVGARVAFEADRQRFVTRGGANWTTAVTLRWTPFDGGATKARIDEALEMARAAEASKLAAKQQANLEIEQAAIVAEASQARVATAESAIAAAEEGLRIVRNRYGEGLATVSDLLRTETTLTETRLRLIAARYGVRVAQLNHAAALGALSPDSEVLQ